MNFILWNSTAESGRDFCLGEQSSITAISSSVGWWTGPGNLGIEPGFVHGADYALSDSSERIGLATVLVFVDGSWVRAPAMDYSDAPRPTPPGSRPDLGAREHRRERPLQRPAIVPNDQDDGCDAEGE